MIISTDMIIAMNRRYFEGDYFKIARRGGAYQDTVTGQGVYFVVRCGIRPPYRYEIAYAYHDGGIFIPDVTTRYPTPQGAADIARQYANGSRWVRRQDRGY